MKKNSSVEHLFPSFTHLSFLECVSVQFSCSVVSDSLRPRGLQHTRPSCPSPTPRVCSNSCSLSWWHHQTIFILCRPLLLLTSIFPSIRAFSNESALHVRWPKCWSFSFSMSPSNEYSGLISVRMDWVGSPCSPRDSQESSPTPQFNLDSLLKNRDITLPTKVRLVKAMVFPVVVYGCESFTMNKAECQRIEAFKLWCSMCTVHR